MTHRNHLRRGVTNLASESVHFVHSQNLYSAETYRWGLNTLLWEFCRQISNTRGLSRNAMTASYPTAFTVTLDSPGRLSTSQIKKSYVHAMGWKVEAKVGWAGKALLFFAAVPSSVAVWAVVILIHHANGLADESPGTLALFAWLLVFSVPVVVTLIRFYCRIQARPADSYDIKKAFRDLIPRDWWWLPLSYATLWFSATEFITGLEWWHGLSVAIVVLLCSLLEVVPNHRIPAPQALPTNNVLGT